MDRLDRVLDELMELKAEQARQGVRLDTYNEQLNEHMRRSDNLEQQVSELYKWKYYVAGAVAFVTILGGAAFQILLTWFNGDK